MSEKIVAVALQVVANEFVIVAVCDEADALGQERVLDLDLFQADRPLLARDLGQSGDLVDQLALGDAAKREREFRAEREPMENRGQREADEGRCERAAEDHDGGVGIREHPQIAPHQDEGAQHHRPCDQTEAGCDIHRRYPKHHANARAGRRQALPPAS